MSDTSAHAKFFEKALTAASEWTRFADPKLLGVLVLLGLGVSNLVSKAGSLWDAHDDGWFWGWASTLSFVAAAILAALAVLYVSLGLFPRMKRKGDSEPSLFFFAGIAGFDSPSKYEDAVRAKSEGELESEVARQAWEVASIATEKHRWAKAAYRTVVAFLVAWAVARLGLSFTD
jgi:hypothetical protein